MIKQTFNNSLLMATFILFVTTGITSCSKKEINDIWPYPFRVTVNETKYISHGGFSAGGGPSSEYLIFKDGVSFSLHAYCFPRSSDTGKPSLDLKLKFCSESGIQTGRKYLLSVPKDIQNMSSEKYLTIMLHNYKISTASIDIRKSELFPTFGNGYIEFSEIDLDKERIKGTYSFKAPSPLGKDDNVQEWAIDGQFEMHMRVEDFYKDKTMDEVMQEREKN